MASKEKIKKKKLPKVAVSLQPKSKTVTKEKPDVTKKEGNELLVF